MNNRYLLAASLLTTVPTITELPSQLPGELLNLIKNLITNEISVKHLNKLPINPHSHNIANPELSPPEFCQTGCNLVADISFINQKQTTTTVRPQSGSQMYLQRLAALEAGTIYTRLPVDSFESYWSPKSNTAKKILHPNYEQWKELLSEEAKAIAKGQGVNRLGILVGDSLSMWFPSSELPSGRLWLNQGISGDTSHGVKNRIEAFNQTRPDRIYVLAGINDLLQGKSDLEVLRNLYQTIKSLRLKHPQAQIIVQSILPTRREQISNQRIRFLNNRIAKIAQDQKAHYLNLHPYFADTQGKLRTDLTTDGLHLSINGYQVWRNLLEWQEVAIQKNLNQISSNKI